MIITITIISPCLVLGTVRHYRRCYLKRKQSTTKEQSTSMVPALKDIRPLLGGGQNVMKTKIY
jgi:hypothetical protein